MPCPPWPGSVEADDRREHGVRVTLYQSFFFIILLACAYIVKPDKVIDNVFYASFDHGKTWLRTLQGPVSVDPSCEIGLHGVGFASSVHDKPRADGNSDSFLLVHRSADGGRTWKESSISIDTRSIDHAYLTVGSNDGPLRGQVYVHGYLQQPKDASGKALPLAFVLLSSSDGGNSFDRAVVREGNQPGTPWFFPANGIVAADGTFIALVVQGQVEYVPRTVGSSIRTRLHRRLAWCCSFPRQGPNDRTHHEDC